MAKHTSQRERTDQNSEINTGITLAGPSKLLLFDFMLERVLDRLMARIMDYQRNLVGQVGAEAYLKLTQKDRNVLDHESCDESLAILVLALQDELDRRKQGNADQGSADFEVFNIEQHCGQVAEQISEIWIHAGQEANRAIGQTLRIMVEAAHEGFELSNLQSFRELCEAAGSKAPELCEKGLAVIDQQFPLLPFKEKLSVIVEVNHRLKIESAKEQLQFLGSALKIVSALDRGAFERSDLLQTVGCICNCWSAWKRTAAAHENLEALERLSETLRPIKLEPFLQILISCAQPLPFQACFDRVCELKKGKKIGTKGAQQFLALALRWTERLGQESAFSVADFFSTLSRTPEGALYRTVGSKILESLRTIFQNSGSNRLIWKLPLLASALRQLNPDGLRSLVAVDAGSLREHAEELLFTTEAISLTPQNLMLSCLYIGGDRPSNPWRRSPHILLKRLEEWNGQAIEPLAKPTPFRAFNVNVGARELPPDKGDAIRKSAKKQIARLQIPEFLANEKIRILWEIAKGVPSLLGEPPPTSLAFNLLLEVAVNVLKLQSKNADSDEIETALSRFKTAAVHSVPLLPAACDLPLRRTFFNEMTDSQMLSLLTDMFIFLEDYIPDAIRTAEPMRDFQSNQPQRDQVNALIKIFKQCAKIDAIEQVIDAFQLSSATSEMRVELLLSKNAIDSFYDQLAETCIVKNCGQELDNPIFHPLRLIDRSRLEIIGCCYLALGKLDQKKILILAGGGPAELAVSRMDLDQFVDGLINSLNEGAPKLGINGGVYLAVGDLTQKEPHRTEGRTAQAKQVRDKLLERRQGPQVQLDNVAPFPRHYSYGPIVNVVPL